MKQVNRVKKMMPTDSPGQTVEEDNKNNNNSNGGKKKEEAHSWGQWVVMWRKNLRFRSSSTGAQILIRKWESTHECTHTPCTLTLAHAYHLIMVMGVMSKMCNLFPGLFCLDVYFEMSHLGPITCLSPVYEGPEMKALQNFKTSPSLRAI